MKSLDKIANIAIIIAVAVFLVVVGRNQFQRHYADGYSENLIGKAIKLPDLRFPMPRRSIILALSTNCHFCQDSLPFYRTLATQTKGKVDLIAVFPQTDSGGRDYLEHATVSAAKVVSTDLSAIGVRGTPTVFLVGRDGKIQGVWNGFLTREAQEEIVQRALSE